MQARSTVDPGAGGNRHGRAHDDPHPGGQSPAEQEAATLAEAGIPSTANHGSVGVYLRPRAHPGREYSDLYDRANQRGVLGSPASTKA